MLSGLTTSPSLLLQLLCTSAQGIGAGFVFSVRVGGQWSDDFAASTVAYFPPTITSIGTVPVVSAMVGFLDT
jgi:hypothetical protein